MPLKTAAQIIALVLLGIEIIRALQLMIRNESVKRTGIDLLLDAVIWITILTLGSFWD